MFCLIQDWLKNPHVICVERENFPRFVNFTASMMHGKYNLFVVLHENKKKINVKMQVERESKSVGLEKEDALNQARWRGRVGEIAVRVG